MNPQETHDKLAESCRTMLRALGRDPGEPGLLRTPDRFARAWLEMAAPRKPPTLTMFEEPGLDEMVVASAVEVWSVCEHHLLPFNCTIAAGFIARGRTIGLSKIPRLAWHHARALQLQERLVEGIRADLAAALGHDDVAVAGRGTHLCASARGVRTRTMFTTLALTGVFRSGPARAEFLAAAALGGP